MFKKIKLPLILMGLLLVSLKAFSLENEVVELEPIVITPTRTQEKISDITRGVTVLDGEDIERTSANYLPEVVQFKSGITVSDYLGNPKGTVVDIRGFGETSPSNVLVLVDGRRTNQVDLSGTDWAQIDLNSVEKIEIVRGPGTVLYGDNAAAGVINIITKRGRGRSPMISLGGALGSYDYYEGYFTASGSEEFIDYFLSYSHHETDGYRDNNAYWSNDYFGGVTMHPAGSFSIDISSGYHRDRYGMPGALYPFELAIVGRRGTTHPDDKATTSDFFFEVDPQLDFSLAGSEVKLSFFNSYRIRRSNGLNVSMWGEFETVHYIRTYELKPKIEIATELENIDNVLIMGLDHFNARDAVLSGNRIGAMQDKTDIIKGMLGVYLHDSIKLYDKILLNGGVRGEWADYKFDQEKLLANYDSKKISVIAYNAGCGYKYNDRSKIYFNFSRSFRLPNTEEYYQNKGVFWGVPYGGLNRDLEYQQSNNYELGVRDNTYDWSSFGTSIFLMDVKNEIYFDPATFKNSNYRPLVRHYGLELEGKLDLFDGRLKPFAEWTLQKSYFRGGIYAGNHVPFVPQNTVSAGVTVTPLENFNVTLLANYVGRRYLISDQKNIAPELKDYTVFDIIIDYTFKKIKAFAAVKNLFAKEYYVYGVSNAFGVETFYPAAERRFEFGFSCEF